MSDPTDQVRVISWARSKLLLTGDTPLDDEQFVEWYRKGQSEMWRILQPGGLTPAHVVKHLAPRIKQIFLDTGFEYLRTEPSDNPIRVWLIFRKPA